MLEETVMILRRFEQFLEQQFIALHRHIHQSEERIMDNNQTSVGRLTASITTQTATVSQVLTDAVAEMKQLVDANKYVGGNSDVSDQVNALADKIDGANKQLADLATNLESDDAPPAPPAGGSTGSTPTDPNAPPAGGSTGNLVSPNGNGDMVSNDPANP